MGAPEGNQFWKLRSKHGRDKLFETPEMLWEAACEYFEWCDNNPFEVEKIFSFQGVTHKGIVNKIRPYTLNGLCLYLQCSESYFRTKKSIATENDKDFLTVIDKIEQTIYNQQFSGASADLFNANIIARNLGLSDKTETRVDFDYDKVEVGFK